MKTNKLFIYGTVLMGMTCGFFSCSDMQDSENRNVYDSKSMIGTDTDCECQAGEFEIPDEICIYGKLLKTITPESYNKRLSNDPISHSPAPMWDYCDDGSFRPISTAKLLEAPTLNISEDNQHVYVNANLPLPAEGKSSDKQPTIYAYTVDSEADSTLYFIISYNGDSTYNSQNIKFSMDISSEYNQVISYFLKDDPKTSRGTVTTVQSHNGKWEDATTIPATSN